jgi:hypothetical protein
MQFSLGKCEIVNWQKTKLVDMRGSTSFSRSASVRSPSPANIHIAIMLARPISRRAAGAIRSSLPSSSSSSHLAACRTNGVRHFSTPIVEKPRAHRTAGGQNSLVVGSAVLGATIVAGYIFGRGETLDKKTIEKTGESLL